MKIHRFLFAVLLILALSTTFAHAESVGRNQELETELVTNATGAGTSTLVAVTTIIPAYHRILGFRMAPYDTTLSSEFTFGVCDAATIATALDATLFDEAEKSLTTSMDAEWYKLPKRLTNGLVVRQGANTNVTIYYEDTRKF